MKEHITCSYITNNQIYCLGGWNEKYETLKSVEIFDTKRDKILNDMMYLNIPRANHSVIIYNNQLLVLGGYSGNNAIERLYIDTIAPTFIPSIFPTFQPASKTTSGNVVGWGFGIRIAGVLLQIISLGYRHCKSNKLEQELSMLDSEEKSDDSQQNLNAPLVNKYDGDGVYHEKQSCEFCHHKPSFPTHYNNRYLLLKNIFSSIC